MIHIHFDKARAEAILASLDKGEAIPPANGMAWTVDDALMLAGVLMRVVCVTAPLANEGERLTSEVVEHRALLVTRDVAGAFGYLAKLTEMVTSGTYDQSFEPIVEGVLKTSDGGADFVPTRGVKLKST